jgi:uncharacterized protein (TIGR02145 family)
MKILKMSMSSLALLLSVTVVLLGCGGDKGTGGSGGGGDGGGDNNTGGNNTGYTGIVNKCGADGTADSCKTVEIGGKTWMAENLNYQTDESWCYNDKADSCAKYGRLYTWEAAKNACQSVGWRLSSRDDWDHLAESVGGIQVYEVSVTDDRHRWDDAGKKLRSRSGWDGNGNGTDDFGFSALPGGIRFTNGSSDGAGVRGYWWTVSGNSESGYYWYMSSNYDRLYEDWHVGSYCFSVRCIKTD